MSIKKQVNLMFAVGVIANVIYLYFIITGKSNFISFRDDALLSKITRYVVLFLLYLILIVSKKDSQVYSKRMKYIIPLVLGILLQCVVSLII